MVQGCGVGPCALSLRDVPQQQASLVPPTSSPGWVEMPSQRLFPQMVMAPVGLGSEGQVSRPPWGRKCPFFASRAPAELNLRHQAEAKTLQTPDHTTHPEQWLRTGFAATHALPSPVTG